nr:class I SAM-dependent methyltransferase [Thalassovita aquimarina]
MDSIKRQVRIWEKDRRHVWLTRLATFLWMQLQNQHDRLFMAATMRELAETGLPRDVDAAVHAVMESPFGRPIRPMQLSPELSALIKIVAENKPKTVLEIGTARGGTLLLLCRFASPDATVISVDLPYGRNGGGYPKWKENHYKSFAMPGQKLHLIRADSHAPETVQKVQDLLGDQGVDFLLIDADHSYEGARQDFESYGSLLTENGTIAVHDILPNHSDPSIEVNRLWREIEADDSYDTETIVADPRQGNCGIGLVRVPGK